MLHLCQTVRHALNKAAKRGTKANTEICLTFNMGFIDDITVTAVTNIQDRWILKASNEAVS